MNIKSSVPQSEHFFDLQIYITFISLELSKGNVFTNKPDTILRIARLSSEKKPFPSQPPLPHSFSPVRFPPPLPHSSSPPHLPPLLIFPTSSSSPPPIPPLPFLPCSSPPSLPPFSSDFPCTGLNNSIKRSGNHFEHLTQILTDHVHTLPLIQEKTKRWDFFFLCGAFFLLLLRKTWVALLLVHPVLSMS